MGNVLARADDHLVHLAGAEKLPLVLLVHETTNSQARIALVKAHGNQWLPALSAIKSEEFKSHLHCPNGDICELLRFLGWLALPAAALLRHLAACCLNKVLF
jgi:hypothetical protein